jgi:Lon protease-like protein
LGVLEVLVAGSERFRIHSRRTESSGLLRAEVTMLAAEPVQKVPPGCAALIPLLRAVVADLGERAPPAPHRFFDAAWVGYRWCEVLPIPLIARQKLLELEDSVSRLEIVLRYLEQRGLVK